MSEELMGKCDDVIHCTAKFAKEANDIIKQAKIDFFERFGELENALRTMCEKCLEERKRNGRSSN